MKEELLEEVLEMFPSSHAVHEPREKELFELQTNDSRSGTLETRESGRLDGVVIGMLVGMKDSGEPLVNFSGNTSGEFLPARATVALGRGEIGREVTLMFEQSDPRKPIVMGLIQQPGVGQSRFPEITPNENQKPIETEVDGERLVFTANKEIVLRCGNASITLTRAGKVLIRGAFLLSRSSGVNRIKGASIQMN